MKIFNSLFVKFNFLFILFLILVSINNSLAQFSMSAEAGINRSALVFSVKGLEDFWVNPFLGVQTHFKQNEKLQFNIATSLSARGYSEYRFLSLAYRYKLVYLDVIPSIEYKPINWLGIGLGFYGSAKLFEGYRTRSIPWEFQDNRKIFKRIDAGIYPFLRGYYKKLFLQIGCQQGLVKILDMHLKDLNGESLGTLEARNWSYTLSLGYLLF